MRLYKMLLLLGVFIQIKAIQAQTTPIKRPSHQDTLKGSITSERAWWDVLHYDLTVRPDPLSKTIRGKNEISFLVANSFHTNRMQVDLQAPLGIDSAILKGKKLKIDNEGDAWFISVPALRKGITEKIALYYSGKPKASIKAPWDGGVIWTSDSLGRPWLAVACQLTGASVWYPCKVYQGDKPEKGAKVTLIVPDTLVAVSNGRLQEQHNNPDGTKTYSWAVTNAINNYGLTFYIGKYVPLQQLYAGAKGSLDMYYWVLDYHAAKAQGYLPVETAKLMKSFEYWLGPYPFYSDGYKIVESPYIGMEHQSAVAYGNQFAYGRVGAKRLTSWDLQSDRILVHESAHEWFGNNITVKDPADRWVQEGFAGYAEELFIESVYGAKAAQEFYAARISGRISNETPLIGRYGIFEDAGDDMYLKGWVIVHMIRAIMDNDSLFRKILQGINQHFYHQTVSSAQVEAYISQQSGINFRPLFDQYLRTAQIPVLEYKISDRQLQYRFTHCNEAFTIPVKIIEPINHWIYPTTSWRLMALPTFQRADSLIIDKGLYLETKRVN